MRGVALLLPLLLVAGCGQVLTESTADVAGVAGAGVASTVTKNAATAAAIGLGVTSVAQAGLQLAERRVHGAEQDQIAQVAGALPDGAAGRWSITHDVSIESDEHGAVVVTRMIAARPTVGIGFTCKEIVFSVDGGANPKPKVGFYTATICLDGPKWKWASAEPATARWGSLQ